MWTPTTEDDGFDGGTMTMDKPRPIPFLGTHNATITLTSPKTGDHRTFKISTAKNGPLAGKRILSILIGPNNESDYLGLGFVQTDGFISLWQKHRGTQYEKLVDLLDRAEYWASRGVEYLAEGRCRRCNRKLTRPDSIASGIGSECAGKE
jgi:hypothetical protein